MCGDPHDNNLFTTDLGLLTRYPATANVTWNAVFRHKSTGYKGSRKKLPGHDILSLHGANYTIKIFDRLKDMRYRFDKRRGMSKRMARGMKLDLLDDYEHPKQFPRDMFLRLPNGSPYRPDQEYLIMGQKGTGEVHCIHTYFLRSQPYIRYLYVRIFV